jgi:hypothetical protein
MSDLATWLARNEKAILASRAAANSERDQRRISDEIDRVAAERANRRPAKATVDLNR